MHTTAAIIGFKAGIRALIGGAALVLALPASGVLAATGGAQAGLPRVAHVRPARRAPTRRHAGPRTAVSGRAPIIRSARCTPATSCESNPARVAPGGHLLLTGHLSAGMLVVFAARAIRSKVPGIIRARIHLSHGTLEVVVPPRAISGRIVALDRFGRRSRAYGPIYVARHQAPHAPPSPTVSAAGSPFATSGMWIWHLANSEGGNLDALAARAAHAGISTVFIKSSDGSTNYWGQFSASTVAALKARGLKVCAWQYVYGTYPAGEAALGERAVAAGADCLVIDAEAEYEGRYASAQTYIQDLRAKLGPSFPIGLASFPYVDYHPALPYSVFLGPGGAQYNAPQMYWKDIGTTVDAVYAHTFTQNRIYQRAIFPLGQTYSNPSTADLVRFRQLAVAYGATGTSYWDWEETNTTGWAALARPLTPLTGFTPSSDYPLLGSGSKGDQVVWMQEHLASVAPTTPTSGVFNSTTTRNLQAFQATRSLPVTGQTDPATWQALLALTPVAVSWNGTPAQGTAARARARTARARARTAPARAPVSATLPPVRDEIPRVG